MRPCVKVSPRVYGSGRAPCSRVSRSQRPLTIAYQVNFDADGNVLSGEQLRERGSIRRFLEQGLLVQDGAADEFPES